MDRAIIIIAGASRSGKSTLAAHLKKILQYHVFELDSLYRAVAPIIKNWIPDYRPVVDDIMRKSALSVIEAVSQLDASVIIEGGWLEPCEASKLVMRYPSHLIVVVYVGFPTLDINFAVKNMNLHKDAINFIWPTPRAAKQRFFLQQIEGSRWYRDQCEHLGLTFIDTSHGRGTTLERAARDISHLLKKRLG